jgi:proline iminopeptidase
LKKISQIMSAGPFSDKTENALPFDHGYLNVGGGHQLYFAQYGRLDRPAAVVLHGGPGSGCNSAMLDWFDLSRQRVVLFDQRGAGKSVPLGSIDNNCTNDLIEDIERLRVKLGIPQWLLVGGSWGAVLALGYAARYSGAVSGVVLRGAFLASAREIQWFFQSLCALVPAGWRQMTAGWNSAQRQSVLSRLASMLLNGTAEQRADAARRWSAYENAVMSVMLGLGSLQPARDLERAIAKYTIQSHYLSQGCFTSERAVFRNARKLKSIPVIVIHGTHDLICPPENAIRLMRFLPHAELRWVAKGTHTPSDPLIATALSTAIHDLTRM